MTSSSASAEPQLAAATTTEATRTSDVIGAPESMSPSRRTQRVSAPPATVPPSNDATVTVVKAEGQKGRTTVKHTVVSGENLYSIARRYGIRITDLRNWNNISYDKENIRIGDTLIVAITDEAARSTASADVEKIRVTRVINHTVAHGETLAGIASLYSTSTDRLRELNKLPRNGAVKAGKALRVETSLSKTELAAIERTAPSGKARLHSVRKGENLSAIAAIYGVDEDQLRRWNADVVNGSTVFAGTKLRIYSAQATDKGSAAPAASGMRPPKTYTVRRGDTLSEIADKFGVSVSTLRKKNRNLSDKTLRAGQTIRLQ
jgi:LysM repeat protein